MRPIVHLATRIDRRTRWTAWAIAFTCMVLVGSLSLVDGLAAGVDSATARFNTGPALYLRGSDLLTSAIDENALAAIPTDYATLRAHVGALTFANVSFQVVVASLTEYHDGTGSSPFPTGSQAVALDNGLRTQIASATGAPPNGTANLTLFGIGPLSLAVAPSPSARPTLLPDTWAWVRPELLATISPSQGEPVQAVLTPTPLDPGLAARLGLSPLQTVGAIGFTIASIAEAQSILWSLAAVLAVVIGLLVYNAIGLEVYLRREEIRTLRSLGAAPSSLAAVYTGKASVLALAGATIGSALGIVLAHAFVSFAPLFGFPNLILLPLPLVPVVLAYGLALAAALVGGLVPTVRAVRLLHPRAEARPS